MDKKLLTALVLSIATIFLFNYFTNKNVSSQPAGVPADIRSGQGYVVPSAQDLARPLNTEIDFWDKKITQKEEIKTFETDLYAVSFSNYGAVLSQIEFKKHVGKNGLPLRTIHHKGFYEREESAFLLALNEKTPYFYNLVDTKDLEDRIEVVYQVELDGWKIVKHYIFYKKSYKLNLNLSIEPTSTQAKEIRPRIFFPAPFVSEITDNKHSAFVLGVDGKSISLISDADFNKAWISPSIFGIEDKYFANTLVSDKNGFVQRAFLKQINNTQFSILEGPAIKQKINWDLSFYIGPKSLDDLSFVDARLEGLLSFGWLSWICKLLLKLLEQIYLFVHNFGLAIMILALLIKLPFMPLTILGRRKMEEYQKYQPQISRIRLKYKNDLRLQQEEIMKFHKDHNISPTAPMLGCLPFLIQLPVLFALNKVLTGYLDLYQAPFFGWIHDLSSKDPYYILVILMGLSMLLLQRMTPVADSKQKVINMFMPVLMTALFINFSAGLVLYWLSNNVLMIGEDYLRKFLFK